MTRREVELITQEQIKEILDKSKVLHLGIIENQQPRVIPMNYGYEWTTEGLTLYLHAAKDSTKLVALEQNPFCYISMECDVEPFAGEVACQYGMGYKMLTGSGQAEIITNPEEKIHGMQVLMKTQTQGDFSFTERLVSIVSVIKLVLATYQAKERPVS